MESADYVILLGVSDEALECLRGAVQGLEEIKCDSKAKLASEAKGLKHVAMILVGPTQQNVVPHELTALLPASESSVPIFYLADAANGAADPSAMVRKGFKSCFVLPRDKQLFSSAAVKAVEDAQHRKYSRVSLVDIDPGTVLGFEIAIYLPSNKKYLTFSSDSDVIEPERLARLEKYKQKEVFVPVDQVHRYHSYSARRLLELQSAVPTPENIAKLRNSTRELVYGMVADSYAKYLLGKKVEEHTSKIVHQYVLLVGPALWCLNLIEKFPPGLSGYSHGANVGVYSVLFGLALGYRRVDEVWAAGFLHDLGMEKLPSDLRVKDPDRMSAEEHVVYRRHPQFSLDLAQSSNYQISDSVRRAVLQHHERWDGTGFPDGLTGNKISEMAHLIAMADRFDYLTRAYNNVSPMTADQAVRQIAREGIGITEMVRELRLIFNRD